MTNLKLQINSLEALERLIGGDNSVEISIRENIVQEFSKKHLKNIAQGEALTKMAAAIRGEIGSTFFKAKKGYYQSLVLTDEGRKVIGGLVNEMFSEQVRQIASEIVTEQRINEDLKDKIELAAARIHGAISEKVMAGQIEKLVSEKIKQKLGL